ncbi:hypothetical protein A2380_00990 [candidate division WWE3 bacterium RIFOXYB1_FULL_43_24]|nr:MAG: hypothetical protein A2212_00255 [candidate division WWE3 bacterium RIFOXYA1_FULL_42_9]OGC69511.1 MAG: hypothetical protein A2380_00990 [candidate division WWE3 bacterium RIFOXYB1_FULL_43_24]OGC74009.1 MAG: hypothetical protein A2414_01915 [candidate division WWE3 bacterium RIFOXYC1_FULL_42_13]
MKRFYIPISLLVIIFLLFKVYRPTVRLIGRNLPNIVTNTDNQKNPNSVNKRYFTDLPLEYFDGRNNGGNGEYTYLDQMGYWGEIIPIQKETDIKFENLNEPFARFNDLPNMDPSHDPYWGESIDVDNDGKAERVFYYSIAMNHTPHILNILKDDKIIFRAEGPSIQLVKTESGNGFYTEEYNWSDIPTANTKITRYIHKDGNFTPVWYRNIYVLEVVNGLGEVSGFLPIKSDGYWKYEGIKKEQQSDGEITTTDIEKNISVTSIERKDGITTVYFEGGDMPKLTFNKGAFDFDPDSKSDQKFTLPMTLYEGAKWGNEENLKNRDDGFYVWEVEDSLNKDFNGKTYSCYRIAYKQLPDTKYYVFCRGLGIIEEGYKHNGTVTEYKYKLVNTNVVK